MVVGRGPKQLEEVLEGYRGTAAVLVKLAETVWAQLTQKWRPSHHLVVGLVEVLLDNYLGCERLGHLGSNQLPLRSVRRQVRHSPVNIEMMLPRGK